MSAESAALSLEEPKSHRAIIWGGLLAGILDITSAFINGGLRGRSPMWVLQSVAGGLLGSDSFKGGLRTAALGAVLHFTIATVVCSVYYLTSRRFEILVRRAVLCGLLYGVAVYFFMYGIVLPLTFHRGFFSPLSAVITGLVIHMLCVGLPISHVVRRYSN
ncbi:MAG TPA: hypothetical protein VLM38_12610 [Blastocatellia bacterium]|nr:hypothetical protein [Blastocatellia bacterium]